MADNGESEWSFLSVIYEILADMKIDPETLSLNYRDDEIAARALMAIEDTSMAIAVEGDTTEPLRDDGWYISELSLADLRAAHRIYSTLKLFSFEHIRRMSESNMIKNGSKEEGYLLDAILKAGIDEPDRNFSIRREDGTELTVPDFAWKDLKIAFYIDGLYWHVVKDHNEIMDEIQEQGKTGALAKNVIESTKTRAERDMDNRSALTVMGWRVLACSDEDLHTDEGIAKQVKRITELMRVAIRERKAHTEMMAAAGPDQSLNNWDDLL